MGAPLLTLLPLAIAFLLQVLDVPRGSGAWIALVAYVAYGGGAAVLAGVLLRRISGIEKARTVGEASREISECLSATVVGSAILWLAWGMVVAGIGAAVVMPSLQGIERFGEAALLIAAPAMAWSYWAGKHMLLRRAPFDHLEYLGRVYSIRVKIAMVFIGFFIVSMGALIQLISTRIMRQLQDGKAVAEVVAADITRYGVVIALITAVVFGVATFFLARDITRALNRTIASASEMAGGHFDRPAMIFADDEIGLLARSFSATQDSLRSLIGRVGSSGGAITGYARAMSDGTVRLTEGVHKQRSAAEESSKAAGSVRDESRSVLTAVENVADLCSESAGSAVELSASSSEVAKRMDDLFQSVEKTASSTMQIGATASETSRRAADLTQVSNEVLVFVSEMDATVEEITRTAAATADLSRQVRANAVSGREAVEATVAGVRAAQQSTRRTAGAFESLQKSLGDIDKILVFIDELTDRTNLLSLNAAIIAAQAGENDFGFSVIADEVRQLADRTRNATKDIAAIIRNVQPVTNEAMTAIRDGLSTVDSTEALARKATESLGTILTSAEKSLQMTETISSSLAEQSRASRHLHEVTARVADTISELQRATESQAQGTRLLAEESERIHDIAAQVKRSTEEQMKSGGGIAAAMENIAANVGTIRGRLQTQLGNAEKIASASVTTLAIAAENSEVTEEFTRELQTLVESGRDFENEVAKFKL